MFANTDSPKSPSEMDWASLYPAYVIKMPTDAQSEQDVDQSRADNQAANEEEQMDVKAITKDVEIADIGCGFGGLLFALSTTFPDTLSIGMPSHYLHCHFPFIDPSKTFTNPALVKVWRFVSQLPSTSKRRFAPFEFKTRTTMLIRTSPVCAPTR